MNEEQTKLFETLKANRNKLNKQCAEFSGSCQDYKIYCACDVIDLTDDELGLLITGSLTE